MSLSSGVVPSNSSGEFHILDVQCYTFRVKCQQQRVFKERHGIALNGFLQSKSNTLQWLSGPFNCNILIRWADASTWELTCKQEIACPEKWATSSLGASFWRISRQRRWKGALRMRRFVPFCIFFISLKATVPCRYRRFRGPFLHSCLAAPPFRVVCCFAVLPSWFKVFPRPLWPSLTFSLELLLALIRFNVVCLVLAILLISKWLTSAHHGQITWQHLFKMEDVFDPIIDQAFAVGLAIQTPNQAVLPQALAAFGEPPVLSERLQKRQTSLQRLMKAPIIERLVRKVGPDKTHLKASPIRINCNKTRTYRCSVCQFERVTRAAVLTHINEMKGVNFNCPTCDFKTRNPDSAVRHRKSCGNKLRCQKCNFETIRQFVMNRHGISHLNHKKWGCQFCTQRFKCKYNRRRHELYLHIQNDKKYVTIRTRWSWQWNILPTQRERMRHDRLRTWHMQGTVSLCTEEYSDSQGCSWENPNPEFFEPQSSNIAVSLPWQERQRDTEIESSYRFFGNQMFSAAKPWCRGDAIILSLLWREHSDSVKSNCRFRCRNPSFRRTKRE